MKHLTKTFILWLACVVPVAAQDNGITTLPLSDPLGDVLAEEAERSAPPASDDVTANLVDAPKVRLRGLDTLTNTVNDFEIQVGQTLRFKRLLITVDACKYPSGDLRKDAYAYLRIKDEREEDGRFSGWMIASSPAFSALDHPRYDVWVLSCNTE